MTVLVIGGSGETRQLAQGLSSCGIAAVLTLSKPMSGLSTEGADCYIGRFDSLTDFEQFAQDRNVRAILDAGHPFAAGVSVCAARFARQTGRGYLRLLRPAWRAGRHDRWTEIDTPAEALSTIPQGARVFVGTGRGSLSDLEGLDRGRTVFVRVRDAEADLPGLPGARALTELPPFTVARECALLRELRIDWMVVRNAGGDGAWPKLEAARTIGISVAMLRRPEMPGPQVSTVEEAVQWARQYRSG
ncbi:precorrin-6A/cobalt-precorrin-6A reductase [Poseidonocella sedimentorum]|uniref:Precorrin-6A reductase n=1 Tax=Poseidonocella sedimentorum TaxID=871652 RepID=A0A1I6EP12_9RHOB|nr:precorrin-6A/cobalt-precorrin-6A reductase [Poseidonocella sedimentorum]SFR19479.1 precorrin-6A reductase [Poseidonocella sedimentorum]